MPLPHSVSDVHRSVVSQGWSARYAASALLARYEPIGYAGAGTYSEVWQVRDRQTGTTCALKQLRPEWEDQRVARQLLENEAEVGTRVDSPLVVRVLDAQLTARPRFVVMEWLVGRSLADTLSDTERGPLPCHEALWIARQCAQGMHDLLQAGYLHGDIKPSNIFVCVDGQVKLIDLGFARLDHAAADARNERSSVLAGTPEYMAPESLATGLDSGVAKDIYSLGVTLYQMLAGSLPFTGESVADVLRQQQRGIPPEIRTLAPHVSKEVADFVGRLLAKQPLRRSPGIQWLVRELVHLELAHLLQEVEHAREYHECQ